MSQGFDSPIVLKICASRFLTALFAVIHLGAALLVIPLPVAPAWRFALWCAVAASAYHVLVTHALRRRASVAAISWEREGGYALRLREEEEERACRIASRFVHSWLTVLLLRCDGRRLPLRLVIAFDAVDREAFRRWRARLRLQTAAE